jgi:site-specific DNA-cytosine methylase
VTYLSLFSGIGGFEKGIGKRATCIGYSEIDPYAISIYRSQPYLIPYLIKKVPYNYLVVRDLSIINEVGSGNL